MSALSKGLDQQADSAVATVTAGRIESNAICLGLGGDWLLENKLPGIDKVAEEFRREPVGKQLQFDCQAIGNWDTGLLIFLSRVLALASELEYETDYAGLPEGVRRLLELAASAPETRLAEEQHHELYILYSVGISTISIYQRLLESLTFVGDVFYSLLRFVRGRAQFRFKDLFLIVQSTGPHALPVVSLVSFLVGLILAYMGAAQLERVGAEIYIADLVAIGMVREIGALMTGIIMAGRTGAAFAAELGTMNLNEEIDAFKILGISVIDFLVLPRVLAIVFMLPMLTLYSGMVGILAGMTVSVLVFDFSTYEYFQQTIRALELKQYTVGMIKSIGYAIVIALAGCLRGLQCGRSALAVGQATTSAVVTSIVFIVITASVLTVVFYKLGI